MAPQQSPPVDGAGPEALASAVLRVHDHRGAPVGLGFLVTADQALTCAHVVSAALGLPPGATPEPGARVELDLPLLTAPSGPPDGAGGPRAAAAVERWVPARPGGGGDIAVLRLAAPLPGARPVRLVEPPDVWGHAVRAYGLPSGRPGGVWHSGVLRARQADGWIQADLAAHGYRVSPGFSGGPVWDEQLDGVVGMMAVAEAGEPPAGYLIPTEGLAAVWPELRQLALPPSPFRSLRPLQESDASVFHGRRAETAKLAAFVTRERWTTLVGPSGSGKSSLAMAGVMPRLRSLGASAVVFRPSAGTTPLSALAAALLPLLEPGLAELERLERLPALVGLLSAQGLGDLAARVLLRDGAERLVVVVDQFEEVLTGTDPAAVDDLAAVLFGETLPPTVHVLTTLRADYLETALAHPALGRACSRQVYALGPMTGEQLREIVTAPVDAVPSVSYEAHLVDRILADTGGEAGALPLLAFTLDLLWRRQSAGVLSHRAYEELGRAGGALGDHAEQAWTRHVPAEEEPAARRLFTRLVRVPLGAPGATRRTVPRQELPEEEWRVAQRLAGTRLLVVSRNAESVEAVELAHEALITAWARLRDWVAEDRAFLEWRESVRQDLQRWERAGRPPDLLPTGPTLTAALGWQRERDAELSEAERGYLDLGRRHQRTRGRRRRAFRISLVGVVTISLALGVLFATARRDAAERQADSDSRALVQAAQDDVGRDPARAVMMAIAAYRTKPTPEARHELMRQYMLRSNADTVFSGLPGTGGLFSTSRDGDVVLARDDMGHTLLFVRGRDGVVRSWPVAVTYDIYLMVSPDGHRAGYVAEDGTAGWFDIDRGAATPAGQVHRLPGVQGLVEFVVGLAQDPAAMSPDGRYIATLTRENLVWWDLERGEVAGRVPAPPNATVGLWFGPDRHSLLVRVRDDGDGLVSVDTVTGAQRTVVAPAHYQAVLPSGDRTVVAVARGSESGKPGEGKDTSVGLRRVSDGSALGHPYSTDDFLWGPNGLLAASEDGHRIVVGASSGPTLVDLDQGKAVGTVSGADHGVGYGSVLLSSGGKQYLAVQGRSQVSYGEVQSDDGGAVADKAWLSRDGGRVFLWLKDGAGLQLRSTEPDGGRVLAEVAIPKPAWKSQSDNLAINRDGSLVALRAGPSEVTVRNASTLQAVARISTAGPDQPFGYFFDGADRLVTNSGARIEQWDARTGVRLVSFDAGVFHPRNGDQGQPQIYVAPYWQGGKVVVGLLGDPVLRVLDLGTGRVTESIELDTSDVMMVQFDDSGRHMAAFRRGSVVDLWQRAPLRKELGPLPTVASPSETTAVMRFIDAEGRYLIAAGNAIRVYRTGEQVSVDSYDLRGQSGSDMSEFYRFVDSSRDGKVLLLISGAILRWIVLDPEAWQRDLCRVIGYRAFSAEERRTLPVRIPEGPVCPVPAP